jgi:cytochrome c553
MARRHPVWWLASCIFFLPYPIRAAALPDTLAQRLVACTSCHARTDQARGLEYFPRIGGKPAGYLYNQLTNFRDGRRQYPVMTYMVTHLPDAYLHEIADYFAAQHPPAPPTTPLTASPALLERGRVLARQGDPARKVPACVACHGQALAGTLPTVPGLVGLPRDYVNAQFGAWRNRTRQAHAPDCMAMIAARLTLDDINAVSTWLASLPYVPEARPAAALTAPLPLACGSVP